MSELKKYFVGYLYLLVKPILLLGLIIALHASQMVINWEYYEQYGETGGFLKELYLFISFVFLLVTLMVWSMLYFKKKKRYGSAELLFDKGVNKYLTLIINILNMIIILSFLILLIPYWLIDVPTGNFG